MNCWISINYSTNIFPVAYNYILFIFQGKISLKSMSLDVELPSVWPFEKGKGEMIATDNANGKMMIRGELVLTFKQK